jgi:hypothetical protein
MTFLPPHDLIRQAVDKGPEGVARRVHPFLVHNAMF